MAQDKRIRQRLAELREADIPTLDTAMANAYKNIYQFRKDRLSKPVENVKVVKTNRKEIARILTIKRERELSAAKEG